MSQKAASVPDFSNKTILAVDDNEQNLLVLTYMLRQINMTVETVTDGQNAVDACARKTYDLIFLDHMMPYPDGIETLHLIQNDKAGKNHNTPIIALTANTTPGARENYQNEGFADYLTKPILPESLEEILMKYINVERSPHLSNSNTENTQSFENQMYFLKKNGIDAENGLQYADDDMDFYKKLLTIFSSEKKTKEERLTSALQELSNTADEAVWNSFISKAHGMKGEARGIGATDLGELFYKMELSGKEKNIGKIEKLYPTVMKEWQHIINVIQKVTEV